MKNVSIIYGHRSKLAGIVISLLAFSALLLHRLMHGFIIVKELSSEQHFLALMWIGVLGLYLIAFSREKNDDERVRLIRGKSMQIAFRFTMNVMLALGIVGVSEPKLAINAGHDLYLLVVFGLGFYLLHFNIGLYFDSAWNYSEDESLTGALRKNKLYLIVYILVCIGMLALITLL